MLDNTTLRRESVELTDDNLMRLAPSIFATEAHESRSARFAPVPTIDVLNGLRNEGFYPASATQSRTRDASRRDFTKHMIRLRHRSDDGRSLAVGDSVFEIVIINANDGSSAYRMVPGMFRLVCLNGMMTGTTYGEVSVRHSGNAVHDVIEGAYTVLDEAPRVIEAAERWKGMTLTHGEQLALAESAHMLRFPDHYRTDEGRRETPIRPDQLLRQRRHGDQGTSLWHTFNRVQENVIRGGLTAFGRDANNRRRRTTTREVKGIDQNNALNRALWSLAERMAELKDAG